MLFALLNERTLTETANTDSETDSKRSRDVQESYNSLHPALCCGTMKHLWRLFNPFLLFWFLLQLIIFQTHFRHFCVQGLILRMRHNDGPVCVFILWYAFLLSPPSDTQEFYHSSCKDAVGSVTNCFFNRIIFKRCTQCSPIFTCLYFDCDWIVIWKHSKTFFLLYLLFLFPDDDILLGVHSKWRSCLLTVCHVTTVIVCLRCQPYISQLILFVYVHKLFRMRKSIQCFR